MAGILKYLFLIIIIFLPCWSKAQNTSMRGDIRIMFYNTENLFDTIDNPLTNDNEFLPTAEKHWNNYRYWQKLKHLYQVIAAAGGDSPPEIIGLCEVESFLPLYNLTNNLPLVKYNYTIIHHDSPDERGIDAALLFRKDKVTLIEKRFIPVTFKENVARKTREILYSKLKLGNDTLHVFVNHWPSRSSGESKSEKYRIEAANVLKRIIDSLNHTPAAEKIIVMGDFNDEPKNKSLQILTSGKLINLASAFQNTCKCGSYKFKSHWQMFDQILVSAEILENRGIHTSVTNFKVFRPDFLLVKDETYGSNKPIRTYLGPFYQGGFSDHLPVIVDLYY